MPTKTPKNRIRKLPKISKPTAASDPKLDKVKERQLFLLKLYGRGIRGPDEVIQMYRQKGYDVSERTIRLDRAAVRQTLDEIYKDAATETKTLALAEFDDINTQLQQIAQQALAGDRKSFYAAVQALAQRKDVLISKAKLTGAWVEKQEHSGNMVNFNVDTTKDDIAAFNKAAKDAGEDGSEVVKALK